ncbi:extracellular solute-binding protein family 1 [Sphaerobacter thermophilus DSM 20745]|uniref:Extracellular solute-binding protein family 1 n=1 Tax=Sphaerobacter thermophilus (strain ATCC 49802 / DSM 20745 / KCCM 41009 / NCIMB 13125 / S 6022) TaxID=479434 RepID=D1C9W5_SPHTD|nr:extracellular solute-binding protein family 1 [Sphaerobacter thermophilus DSM 20745]
MNTNRSVSRRDIIRALAGLAGASLAAPVLAACGGEDNPASTAAPTATSQAGTGSGGSAATATSAAATPASTPAGTPAGAPATGTVGGSLTVYSGRSEQLIQAIVDQFAAASGVEVKVRYGDTAEMAAAILEEGQSSPADIFFAQDAGALGAVAREGLLAELPADVLDLVEARFRSPDGLWVGISGRARAVVYNTERLSESDIPPSILDFTDPVWKDRLGWAPTNASFQAAVTAIRVLRGDDVARAWLEGIRDNGARVFENNNAIVSAVIDGEIDAGFVNHYYLMRQLAEAGGDLPARNYIYRNGDPGALVNVAGAGILTTAKNQEQAIAFIRYMLSPEAQTYFAEETHEYPLVAGVPTDPNLVPLSEIQTPDIDLSDLADLEATLEMLRDVGLL